MTLVELLPQLTGFDKIIVTGPQRSGTTLATKVLATELKMQYIFESAFEVDDLEKFAQVLLGNKIVVQAPGLSSIVHLFAKSEGVAIVWMRRELSDVIDSQLRIDWYNKFSNYEKSKYFIDYSEQYSAAIKNSRWHDFQKDKLGERAFELEYESLSTHPLWLPKEQRGEGIQPENAVMPELAVKNYLIDKGGEVNSILTACVRELSSEKMEALRDALNERIPKPTKEELTEQTVERLKDKLSLPVVKMSIGAGLHWKMEAGVDFTNPEEEQIARNERRTSKAWINHDGCAHKGIDIVCAWDAIPLPDACLDYLELGDTVEHVMKFDHDRIYGEWFRLLKPGGRVHISTPNFHRACVEYSAHAIYGEQFVGKAKVSIQPEGKPAKEIAINAPDLGNWTSLEITMQQIYAWGSSGYEYHYYTYTIEMLRAMLEKYGFKEMDFSESPGVEGEDKSMAWWLCVTAIKA